MENRTVVGTCSICGGPVSCPSVWWSIITPVPTCEHCGAVSAQHGPVIPMKKKDYYVSTASGTVWGDDPAWVIG